MEEDPANGGFLYGSGVVITITPPIPEITATVNVEQFNWDYDYIPGEPFGYPVEVNCVSARVAPTTRILSAMCNNYGYVTFPIVVNNFTDINSFTLTLDYDPAVMEYCCSVPHTAVADNFDTTTFYPGRIQVGSFGFDASLADGSVLFHSTFKYNGGSCVVTWNNGDTACVYSDANNGLPLPDLPTTEFYVEGSVAPGFFHWSGNISSDWQDPTNWQNGLVPGSFDNVFIHSSPLPTHYPEYAGDFSLGGQCGNLTLNGGAEFYITGNLTIEPGKTLTIADSGKVTLAGNWTNSGTFNPGQGEVIFGGSGDGNIGGGLPPENFITGLNISTFEQGMDYLTGAMVGPTVNDAHMNVDMGFTFNYLGIDYDQARISTNGWISLDLTGDIPASYENSYLFSDMAPTTALAPWWDDLRIDADGMIYYKTVGTAPNRVFTVEWNNIRAFRTNAYTKLNFQVKLHETTNVIEFCYGDVTGTVHYPKESASIGLKDATGGPGHFVELVHSTSHLMPGCLVSDNDWPDVNYRFTPPTASETQTFHQLSVSKDNGELRISQNVVVTGGN
jgi:hypothetical protein